MTSGKKRAIIDICQKGGNQVPRPQLSRRICEKPRCDCFKPENAEIVLTLDEYEVIRLVDYEKLTHE